MVVQLRPYQSEAVAAVYDHLRQRDDNPCVVIPTAGGKTAIMSAICRDAVQRWSGRVLILAHVKELLEQSAATLRRMVPDLDVGVYSAGLRSRDTGNRVIVAGIQSVYQRAAELDRFDLVLVDECHLLPPDGEGMYQSFLADARLVNPHVRLVGLTATPYRMKDGLICQPENLLNHICYEIGVQELIEAGYLSKLKSKAATEEVDTSGLHVRGGEFISSEMETLMDRSELVRRACEEIVELTADRRSVLVFCVGVRHALRVAGMLENLTGQACETITGETPPLHRSAIIDRFRSGTLKYLTNVNVLTTGFDAPNIDTICLLRPTQSPGLYYQAVGRGFRICEGKDHCLVLDFAGNIRRHGPVDAVKPPDGSGDGPPPLKICPQCREVVANAARICPECQYEFEMASEGRASRRQHHTTATTDAILSGDMPVCTDTRHDVLGAAYLVHVKRGAPEGHPSTLRVDYHIGLGLWQSEWICFEHSGYARAKAEDWWRKRSREDVPATSAEAMAIGEAGGIAETTGITVRSVSGQKYDRIIDYELGPIPPKLDGSDERDDGSLPAYAFMDDSEIPF